MEEVLSVASAAEQLGLSAVQVRRLAREHKLSAQSVGGRWVIPRSEIIRRRAVQSASGRPLSSEMAWNVLSVVNDALKGVTRQFEIEDRRKKYRLNLRLKSAPEIGRWPQWLSRRSEPHRVWIHPSRIERLRTDDRVHAAGAYAEARAGSEIVAPVPDRFYVRQRDWAKLSAQFHLQQDPDGSIEIMVAPDSIPEGLWPDNGESVDLGISLVDMLESSESRDRSIAARALSPVRDELVHDRAH
jgi:excisionase family DNA binding protein